MTLDEKISQHRAATLSRLLNWRDVSNDPDAWQEKGLSLVMKVVHDFPEEQNLLHDILSETSNLEIREEVTGYTALHFAVQSKSLESVKALLAAGADANAKDNNQQTPLMIGLSRRPFETEIISALLANGADPNRQNAAGLTAFDRLKSMSPTPDIDAIARLFEEYK